MEAPQIKSIIEDVRHTVSVASLNFDIWWVYKNKETRSKYNKTMSAYSLFFQTSLRAHFVVALIALYRLYETRKDTSNIPNLIKSLEKLEKFPKATLKRANEIYIDAKPLWRKVSVLRNESFGHLKVETSVEDGFEKAGIKADDLQVLIMLTKKLINIITNGFDHSTHAFNLNATNVTTSMLEALRIGLEERQLPHPG